VIENGMNLPRIDGYIQKIIRGVVIIAAFFLDQLRRRSVCEDGEGKGGGMPLAINCDMGEGFGVPVFGMAETLHETVFSARGIGFVPEFYADLDYAGNGTLIITREHAAVEPTEAAARCLRAIREGKVRSVDGNDIPVRAESICVHSDTPNAVSVAKAVRSALADSLGKAA
jgi:lactam utilization protein B